MFNPLEFGFDECQGGLRPTLNSNRTTVNSIEPQVVLQEVDDTLKPDSNIFYICECAQGTCGDDEVYVLPEEECIMEITTQSREQLSSSNIFNMTIGQVDDVIESELAHEEVLNLTTIICKMFCLTLSNGFQSSTENILEPSSSMYYCSVAFLALLC